MAGGRILRVPFTTPRLLPGRPQNAPTKVKIRLPFRGSGWFPDIHAEPIESGKNHPSGCDVFDTRLKRNPAVFVGPKGWEQQEFARLRFDLEILKQKLRFTAGSRYIIEVPHGDQLSL
jgi:hypothetical protein